MILRSLFPDEIRTVHIWTSGFLCGLLVAIGTLLVYLFHSY